MKKRVLLLSGSPGVGKTTILLNVIKALRAKGYGIGGMISFEARLNGNRIGFQVVDLNTDRSGWLAHVEQKKGPQVGKYRVNLTDLDKIGGKAIVNAVENSDVVAIDEIGPMELFSEKFKEAAEKAVRSTKLVICVVHWKTKNKFIDAVKRREDAELYIATGENREDVCRIIVAKAVDFLSRDVLNKAL